MSASIVTPTDGGGLARLVEAMRRDLTHWAQAHRGTCSVARDPVNVYELIAAATGVLVVLHVAGDENVSPDGPAAPMLKVSIEAIVQRRMGLDSRPDAALSANRGDGKPLFELMDLVRARMLAWRIDESWVHRGRLFYVGMEPLATPEGVPTAAYVQRYALRLAAAVSTYGEAIQLAV